MVSELFLMGLFETAKFKIPPDDFHLYKFWREEYIESRETCMIVYKNQRQKEQNVYTDAR